MSWGDYWDLMCNRLSSGAYISVSPSIWSCAVVESIPAPDSIHGVSLVYRQGWIRLHLQSRGTIVGKGLCFDRTVSFAACRTATVPGSPVTAQQRRVFWEGTLEWPPVCPGMEGNRLKPSVVLNVGEEEFGPGDKHRISDCHDRVWNRQHTPETHLTLWEQKLRGCLRYAFIFSTCFSAIPWDIASPDQRRLMWKSMTSCGNFKTSMFAPFGASRWASSSTAVALDRCTHPKRILCPWN